MQRNYPRHAERGFTLVELSIVLVIIGLIVGGVLVGQDMIKAAEVRATVGQIEKYNTAVNTFRSKYSSLPGDMLNTDAVSFNLTDVGGGDGCGDADRRLEGSDCTNPATVSDATIGTGEISGFWAHLSEANLMDGSYSYNDGATDGMQLGRDMPRTKLDRGGFGVYYSGGSNHFHIGTTSDDAAGAYTMADNLTPEEARNIDSKLDDGFPTTGQVIARGDTTPDTDATSDDCTTSGDCPTNPVCVNTDAASTPPRPTYNVANGEILCQLRLRMM